MIEPVVVMLGRGRVPVDTPLLRADDLGVLRGDGVFETMHVRGGRPWLLDEHLARMVNSAARLELPLPERSVLRELAETALRGWPADQEGALRLVCTRGPEWGGPATVFATLAPIRDATRLARAQGLTVATATLGFPVAVREGAPWLLGGVKALSYAVNMACQRWAAQQGLDDVLWVSTDGYALEAPTSTLCWLRDETLSTVPADQTGVLPGTTARWLLDHAADLGCRATEQLVQPEELTAADGVWLVSSVRGVAAVRELDGVALKPSPLTADLQRLAGHPI
ncbi:aminotransferase class IV [Natronosporangium hydrolyticum]|uniref:Aminotransferase class IV n=1 Tax=Natronosporangium hydrolyticum TaxID=2811111 RepID=A0A895Y9S0_9ACTN|nr:aminotransferase class IV [Natronosporangium hydrolyticum]QSB14514.1 aminotransferase class IV [Natronosporangium hydrolyticum]